VSTTTQDSDTPKISQHVLDAAVSDPFDYDLVSDDKVRLTTRLAEELLELPEFEGERPCVSSHVEHLVSLAKAGRFVPDQVSLAVCICEWDGQKRRINGQHTSWMRIHMPSDWSPSVRLKTYSAKTEEDFRKLYAAMDRGKPRSSIDVIRSRTAGTTKFSRFPEKIIKLLSTGIRQLEMGNGSNVNADEISELLLDSKYSDVAVQVAVYLESCAADQKHIKNGSVVAAMIGTFAKSPTAARSFWNMVRSGVGIQTEDDPRSRLRVTLMTSGIEGGSTSKPERKSLSRRSVVNLCIHAWNLWRAEKSCKALRIPASRPIIK
jgi:hypothetical protein